MKNLDWRTIDRRALANLLKDSAQVASQAVGEATVYRLDCNGRELLAISLPGGEAIVVERALPQQVKRRRRVDAGKISPASR